ncbi:MAG: Ku protein, partial [Syntrophomonadaceae bacterium]|nr:Ku protein [Syntrophomonadaceae bacterium]
MRSIWKGAISFGLINIPIKVYTATEDQDLHFNYLHAECQTPLQYKRWCPRCEREVDSSEMIRGYEYEKGKYVLIKEEDLAGIAVEKNRTIDIIDFVNLADIDPVYFARSYYLAPAQGGGKAY